MVRLLVFLLFFVCNYSYAGRSGVTQIEHFLIKTTHVEIYVQSSGGCGSNPKRWHLPASHPSYQALLSGFIASMAAGKSVDISGIDDCNNASHEEIDWAYILK